MNYIKSCGFIAFKRVNGENLYLLIQSHNGDIGFPKGHVESNETEIQAATRELKEETNIEVKAIPEFRRQIEYKLHNLTDTVKISVYFLGECISEGIVCQESEVESADFFKYSTALQLLTFKDTKALLSDAEAFINDNYYLP